MTSHGRVDKAVDLMLMDDEWVLMMMVEVEVEVSENERKGEEECEDLRRKEAKRGPSKKRFCV
jgi:hypothetical protein